MIWRFKEASKIFHLPKPMNKFSYLILSLIPLLPLFLSRSLVIATGSLNSSEVRPVGEAISIGAIFDYTSRPGKEAKVAIEIAIHDFEAKTNQRLVLHSRNSQRKSTRASLYAKELIDAYHVKAILGAHSWEEAFAIAEVTSEVDDPPLFFSLADTTPPWATHEWHFLVQASPDQAAIQMDAVAAIVEYWGRNQVTLIYENTPQTLSSASVISHLSQALRQTGSELTHILPVTSFPSSFDEVFEVLMKQKHTVFIVHTSLELGIRLFEHAKKLEPIGEDNAWITTNRISDLLHSISIPTSMNGIIGVKTYFPESSTEFKKRFHLKFRTDYPDEDKDEPGIYAVQAYQAATAIFAGRKIKDLELAPAKTVEIVGVIGKNYQSGYWTSGLGFSQTLDDEALFSANPMENLGQIFWQVQPWHSERRPRILAGIAEPLKVGVPANSLFKQFVNYNPSAPRPFTGFSIATFEAMMNHLPNLTYKYIAFHGRYDEMVAGISTGEFDAVAGDVTILSKRHDLAAFTQPYTESGLEMIVPVRSRMTNRIWLFMKPFTRDMWILIAAITLYNGFTLWLIERREHDDLRGSVVNQVGVLIWLSFTTLFMLRGDKLHSNLSRIAMVVWLFVALIITQSYTASLASMLTVQRLEPTIKDVETLRNMNATVGYCNGSFINEYLTEVLGFKSVKVRSYNSTLKYAEALRSGEIAAIFLEVPSAKVFLAQYCKSFVRTGVTFKVGGFGFAFRKNFPLLRELNKALMNVSESGELLRLEEDYVISEKCVDMDFRPDEDASLRPDSFWVLFGLTGCISTAALVIYVVLSIRKLLNSELEYKNIFTLLATIMKRWQHRRRQSSSRIVSVETPDRYQESAPNTLDQV